MEKKLPVIRWSREKKNEYQSREIERKWRKTLKLLPKNEEKPIDSICYNFTIITDNKNYYANEYIQGRLGYYNEQNIKVFYFDKSDKFLNIEYPNIEFMSVHYDLLNKSDDTEKFYENLQQLSVIIIETLPHIIKKIGRKNTKKLIFDLMNKPNICEIIGLMRECDYDKDDQKDYEPVYRIASTIIDLLDDEKHAYFIHKTNSSEARVGIYLNDYNESKNCYKMYGHDYLECDYAYSNRWLKAREFMGMPSGQRKKNVKIIWDSPYEYANGEPYFFLKPVNVKK